ncbi:ThiF family adenylyltransferase [Actinosynnema sp. NPDC023658]|uniref:HesA/MoeB/ThiF family protein n=1 Tax=Actinosynnema sp. NPDC023658 TaxID=3155465 RepID=UPI0033E669D6
MLDGDETVRLGGIVPGLRRDLVDRSGWRWQLFCLLNGSRTVDDVVSTMAEVFPGVPAHLVRAVVGDLESAGYLEDADAAVDAVDERYRGSAELYGWMDLSPHRTGADAQKRLQKASVAVIGLGGAGCTAVLDLVLAGVGRVHCVDRDVVERSNLGRQILYTEADVEKFKAHVAVRKLREHNSAIDVTGEVFEVTGQNDLRGFAEKFDVLLLTADKPSQIRSWANRACLATGTPWVYGGYHGPLTGAGLFRPGEGACFECVQAEQRAQVGVSTRMEWPPAAGQEPPHAVDATTAGLTGNFAARAVISLLTGIPRAPSNLQFGYNVVKWRETIPVTLAAPSPRCPACGPSVRGR